jgi:hypothetical protein
MAWESAQRILMDRGQYGWSSGPGFQLTVNLEQRAIILSIKTMRERDIVGETFTSEQPKEQP